MKIFSKRFKRELEFDDKLVISLPQGLPGFSDSRKFCILEMGDPDSPFKWFHDIENTDLAFLITDPYLFFAEYNPQFNMVALDALGIECIEKDMMIFTIVKITPGGKSAFTNLRAPVVVNSKTMEARQIILEQDDYSVKTPLFTEASSNKAAAAVG